MKRNLVLFLAIVMVVLFMTSCTTSFYYQVYKVKPQGNLTSKTNQLFYEDDNCKISYNLWTDGGNIGFTFYNKTDEDISVKLKDCYFILNGYAYDYFKNRTFTSTESNSAAVSKSVYQTIVSSAITKENNTLKTAGVKASVSYAVSIKEDEVLRIPAKTSKTITEYSINSSLIRNCELLKYPNKRNIETISYTSSNSPLSFSNRIKYEIKGVNKLVENAFYVSEITNYPESEFYEMKYEEYCNQKKQSKTKFFKFNQVDKFYIQYKRGMDYFKH